MKEGIPSLGPWPLTQVILATDIWLGLMVDLVPSLRSSASSYIRVHKETQRNACDSWYPQSYVLTPHSFGLDYLIRVTSSASRAHQSPTCGISFSIRGIKVVCVFRCFRANEASATRTFASNRILNWRRIQKTDGCGEGSDQGESRVADYRLGLHCDPNNRRMWLKRSCLMNRTGQTGQIRKLSKKLC